MCVVLPSARSSSFIVSRHATAATYLRASRRHHVGTPTRLYTTSCVRVCVWVCGCVLVSVRVRVCVWV